MAGTARRAGRRENGGVSIRKRGPRSYLVQVSPFKARTLPTREAAERVELDLKLRKAMGELYEERPTTLGAEVDGALDRIRAARDPRPRTVEYYERCAKVWAPFRSTLIPHLHRPVIEDFITARAAKHPRSAKNELQFL